MPVLALAAAQLDHATKERIKKMIAQLKHARTMEQSSKDPRIKKLWGDTAHTLNEALGRLRFGPFEDTEPAGQESDSAVDSKQKPEQKGGGSARAATTTKAKPEGRRAVPPAP